MSPRRQRLYAAKLFAAGLSRAEVARRLGVARSTAGAWFRRWREGGRAALASSPRLGRPPRLAREDLRPEVLHGLRRALGAPPRLSGFDLDRWSLAAAAALVQRATGVAHHPRHVRRVLRRIGWVIPPVGRAAADALWREVARDPEGNTLLFLEGPSARAAR